VYTTTGLEIQNVLEELDPEGRKTIYPDVLSSKLAQNESQTFLLFIGF